MEPETPAETAAKTAAATGPKTPGPKRPSRVKARRRSVLHWLLGAATFALLAAALAFLVLLGRPIPAPDWLIERVEARANQALAGRGRLTVERLELVVEEGLVPQVRVYGMQVFSAAGAPLGALEELRMTLHPLPLLSGQLEPSVIRIAKAQIRLSRDLDGSFGLSVGATPASAPGLAAANLPEALDMVDRAFALPILHGIERIEAQDVGITFSDARSGRTWFIRDGRATMTQDADEVSISVGLSLAGIGDQPATAELSFTTRKSSQAARFGARIANVSAADLATQSPALAWLGVLDAPISGSFRSVIGEDGQIRRLDATLDIAAGAIRPGPNVAPVRFERARTYFSYDPQRQRIEFSEIIFDSKTLGLRADGKAWLGGIEGGLPKELVAQVRINALEVDPEALFATPVGFSRGAIDLKLTLDPLTVSLGQMVLVDGDRRISARGKVRAGPEGWTSALDVTADAISHQRLLELWPVALVPKTRAWIAANVATGELFDVNAAFRAAPGVEPQFSLGYEFRGAEVKVIKTLPPVRDASGYAVIHDNTYTLVVDQGHLIAPVGGRVNMAGSVLRVPDIRIIGQPAGVNLRTESTITAALSLLNQPPFNIMSKAGRAIDLAEGRARAEVFLSLPLVAKLQPEDVDYAVNAELTQVTTDKIVPNHVIVAPLLVLNADRKGMTISGPGTISGLPFDVTWSQQFGPEARGRSRVEGTVELSPRFLEVFAIGLPAGTVTGSGRGEVEIALRDGAPALFRLTSDLARIGLSVPAIGWTKPAGQSGRLEVTGALGSPPAIDAISLTAPGLKLEGSVALNAGGGLDVARFTAVDLGWFRGSAELRGRGAGRSVAVAVLGGSADMTHRNFGGGARAGGGQGGDGPLSVALEKLQVTSGIALSRFSGDFSTAGGLAGRFEGLVNGEAAVSGTITPVAGGRGAIRIASDDAGAVFRAAGLFSRGRGGALSVALDPSGAEDYDGRVSVADIRVKDAPVLADLLSAVSVIGLLEQMSGEGLLFNEVVGRFRLTEGAVYLSGGRASGASLGVTMEGRYDTARDEMDLQGVVSPLYILNAVGQVVSKPGEGLFGFNYRLTGPADAPKVKVNPLSILAPGFLRGIFRKKPVEVPE